MIKNLLFNAFGYVGIILIILLMVYGVLACFNKILHIKGYIIMYLEYKKHKELYINKENLIVTHNGRILFTGVDASLEQQIEILDKAKEHCNSMIKMRDFNLKRQG